MQNIDVRLLELSPHFCLITRFMSCHYAVWQGVDCGGSGNRCNRCGGKWQKAGSTIVTDHLSSLTSCYVARVVTANVCFEEIWA